MTPTYNRQERLHRVLSALACQDVDETFEVIVISDGSTDGTDGYLEGDRLPLAVVPLFQENSGPAVARNAGIAQARGELVVFLDDDVVPEPGLLRAHCDAHRRLGDKVVVIGPMLDPPDHMMSPWIAWEQTMLAKQYNDMSSGRYAATSRQFYTGNASVRREHLLSVGGFDPRFRRAEDVELAFRLADLGLSFHFDPAARGHHYAARSYEAWKATAYDYGRNDIVFARDCGRTWIAWFSRERFDDHHPVIRWLTRRSVHSDRWRSVSERVMESVVRRRALAHWHRYALSAVYAMEFHRGISDELGSPDAFDRLVGDRVLDQTLTGGPLG